MRILIYYPAFGDVVGGSENRALSFICALQKHHELTLGCEKMPNFTKAREQYGFDVDESRLKIALVHPRRGIVAKLLPSGIVPQLRKLAKSFDVCISCYNMVDFGRPGVHFIYMMNFDKEFQSWATGRRLHDEGRLRKLVRKLRFWLRDRFVCRVRSPKEILCDRNETVIPNSFYVKEKIETYYGARIHDPFYPPTMTPVVSRAPASSVDSIITIGRISPEKGIESMIRIVERLRTKTGRDIRFYIVGYLDDGEYSMSIRQLVEDKTWIILTGVKSGKDKLDLLYSAQVSLHSRRDEEFGISNTEYLKAGLVPVVPDEGGAYEVVADEDLSYKDEDDAVSILAKLVDDKKFYAEKQKSCLARGAQFTREKFCERQDQLLSEIVGAALNRCL